MDRGEEYNVMGHAIVDERPVKAQDRAGNGCATLVLSLIMLFVTVAVIIVL